jgi:nucleotide-binding universal stress UspA family protein
MPSIASILVAVDFSEASLHALDEAIELASRFRARVVVCHAYRVSAVVAAILGGRDELAAAVAAAAERELANIVGSRSNRGVEIVSVVRPGRPIEQIRTIAEEVGAGLIVVGAHEPHGLQRYWPQGKLATRLVREKHMPVCIVYGGRGRDTICDREPTSVHPR